jgi:hypothetical protein
MDSGRGPRWKSATTAAVGCRRRGHTRDSTSKVPGKVEEVGRRRIDRGSRRTELEKTTSIRSIYGVLGSELQPRGRGWRGGPLETL